MCARPSLTAAGALPISITSGLDSRAPSGKVSDELTVPLCRIHHRELHRGGDEKQWWHMAKIDPIAVTERLWRKTRICGR